MSDGGTWRCRNEHLYWCKEEIWMTKTTCSIRSGKVEIRLFDNQKQIIEKATEFSLGGELDSRDSLTKQQAPMFVRFISCLRM